MACARAWMSAATISGGCGLPAIVPISAAPALVGDAVAQPHVGQMVRSFDHSQEWPLGHSTSRLMKRYSECGIGFQSCPKLSGTGLESYPTSGLARYLPRAGQI